MHGKQLGSKTVVRRKSRKMRHEIERAAHVLRTASGEEGIEPRQRRAIDGGKLGEPRVVAAVAREQRKWNACSHGRRGRSPRRRSANSRGRRADGSPRSARRRSPARHRDQPTSGGGAAKDWRGGATEQPRPARTTKRRAHQGRCRRRTGTRGRRAIGRDRRRLPPRPILSSRAPGDAWSSPEFDLRSRRDRARARRSPRYGLAVRHSARDGRRSSGSVRPPPAPQGAEACR